MSKRLFWLIGLLVILTLGLSGAVTSVGKAAAQEDIGAPPEGVTELNILWAQWDPADYLQEIANMYEAEYGIKVNVIQEPWGSFQDLFFTEMSAQGTSYDMVVGDSQWLGQASNEGHYEDMTEFLTSTGIAKTVTPATLQYYGEYPAGSGTYWAYPTEGDANGWAYRKDLFEDPAEQEAFKAEYGYDLAPPKTYAELKDIAEFFTRPDQNLYGVAIYTQADYDALTMGVQNALFSFGAGWSDFDNNATGAVNSPEAIEAVQAYRDLYDCCQAPGLSNAFFVEVNDAFIGGQVAMAMNYFAFFPALVNPEVSPYAEQTGFFVNPKGPGGEQYAALGGQGMSIISYISDEQKEAAKHFIKWFAQGKTQQEWAKLGGYTCNINVLQSQAFLDAAPYNPAFAETMTFVKDFWNIPIFGELLRVSQAELGKFIIEGQGTAQETMDAIAEQHQQILQDAGYVVDIGAPPEGVTELNILWAQWDPADYLQEIANMYEAEYGIKVNVIQEPWGSFQDLFFTEMSAQGTSYDMVVGDSQWLGQASNEGHYEDMTEFLTSTGIAKTVTPATLQYYGEYPAGSGTYWAYPTEGDANGWAYRKDLFEDPAEQEAFKAEYGYDLAPPKTYAELKDIAEFFTRPDQNLYGVAIYTQADYDALTMGVQNALFSFGAGWSDANNNPMGVVNSPEAIEAVQAYRDLYDCCQAPGLSNAFFVEVNDAFIGGQVAMAMNYFAFFPALVNPEVSPYAEQTGFFVNPKGPGGEQYAALGGQGMSIISYISDEQKEAAKHFIKWFAQGKTQQEWAKLGGYTCHSRVLASAEFQNAAPYNPAFAETMTFVKDFWNIPIFGELLRVSQAELGKFIIEGQGTAQETMDAIAEQHQQILQDAGFIK